MFVSINGHNDIFTYCLLKIILYTNIVGIQIKYQPWMWPPTALLGMDYICILLYVAATIYIFDRITPSRCVSSFVLLLLQSYKGFICCHSLILLQLMLNPLPLSILLQFLNWRIQ